VTAFVSVGAFVFASAANAMNTPDWKNRIIAQTSVLIAREIRQERQR